MFFFLQSSCSPVPGCPFPYFPLYFFPLSRSSFPCSRFSCSTDSPFPLAEWPFPTPLSFFSRIPRPFLRYPIAPFPFSFFPPPFLFPLFFPNPFFNGSSFLIFPPQPAPLLSYRTVLCFPFSLFPYPCPNIIIPLSRHPIHHSSFALQPPFTLFC